MSVEYFSAGSSAGFEDFHDITCDSCETSRIQGNRYDCHSCPTTLCQNCYLKKDYGEKSYVHNDFHTCKVIPCALDRLSSPQQQVDCNGCGSERFLSLCYRCEICEDFNLCERCHVEGRYAPHENTVVKHEQHHPVKEIPPAEINDRTPNVLLASAIEFQRRIGSQMVDQPEHYDLEEPEHLQVLGHKIGFALYGPPTQLPEGKNVFGYPKKQEKQIRNLCKYLQELGEKMQKDNQENKDLRIAFIFIRFFTKNAKIESAVAVLRIYNNQETKFMEPSGRTYDDWEDFTKKNKFPEGDLVCPKDGVYVFDKEGRIELEMRRSADCKPTRQIAKTGDIVATVGAVGATALGLVGLFTPLAPVAATTLIYSGAGLTAWALGRTGQQMYDRATHNQTLQPFADRDAFFCWFTLLSVAAPIGSTLAVNHLGILAQEGATISQTAQILTNVAIFGAVGIGGFGLFSSMAIMVDNLRKGHKPSPLEIFQLSAGIVFFSHSLMNVQQASKIIADIQNGQLSKARDFLPTEADRKNFDKTLQDYREKHGEFHGGQMTLQDFKTMRVNQDLAAHHEAPHKLPSRGEAFKGGMSPPDLETNTKTIASRARLSMHGKRTNDEGSVTTILSMEPDELNDRLRKAVKAEQMNGRHDVELKGTYHAINQHFDPKTNKFRAEYLQVENPVFGLSNGEPIHFNADASGNIKTISQQRFYEKLSPSLNEVTPIKHITLKAKFPKRQRKNFGEKDDENHE